MRVIFMGTPGPAAICLRAVAEKHSIAAVYTQPDRPSGRGQTTHQSPVKRAAVDLGLDVRESVRVGDVSSDISALASDVIVVVAYGQILPASVLSAAKLGCVNVHFSLLPRWRGAAPVERAIMAGDNVTGVTTMLMDEGLDTGPMLLVAETPIVPDDTSATLLARLSDLGAQTLLETLSALEAGTVTPTPQDDALATYAKKVSASEGQIDFSESAESTVNLIRAFNPRPGAFTTFRGRRLKVHQANRVAASGEAGTITDLDGPIVACGDAAVKLELVQPEGKKSMSGQEFVNGYRPEVGEKLGGPI